MKKGKTIAIAALMMTATMSAQVVEKSETNHPWDVGITAGSTGLGVDVARSLGDYVKVRAGMSYMPHFTKEMHFGVQVGDKIAGLSEEENRAEQTRRIEHLTDLMSSFTGYRAKSSVCMLGEPTMLQFKLLADVYPFKKNKNWHLTAGFYIGNKRVAKAYNTTEDMLSLTSVAMYNRMYWTAYYEQDMFTYNGVGAELPPAVAHAFLVYGSMAYRIGEFKHDFYATQDMYYDHDVYDLENYDDEGRYLLLHKKGDVQYHKGDLVYHKGDEYKMLPGQDMMVKAKALVNAFRPYVGFGYAGAVSKDKRTNLSVDCGVLVWGGTPKIVTQDGVDMLHDLTNVNGRVGHYLNIIDNFPVYPVLDVRISRSF